MSGSASPSPDHPVGLTWSLWRPPSAWSITSDWIRSNIHTSESPLFVRQSDVSRYSWALLMSSLGGVFFGHHRRHRIATPRPGVERIGEGHWELRLPCEETEGGGVVVQWTEHMGKDSEGVNAEETTESDVEKCQEEKCMNSNMTDSEEDEDEKETKDHGVAGDTRKTRVKWQEDEMFHMMALVGCLLECHIRERWQDVGFVCVDRGRAMRVVPGVGEILGLRRFAVHTAMRSPWAGLWSVNVALTGHTSDKHVWSHCCLSAQDVLRVGSFVCSLMERSSEGCIRKRLSAARNPKDRLCLSNKLKQLNRGRKEKKAQRWRVLVVAGNLDTNDHLYSSMLTLARGLCLLQSGRGAPLYPQYSQVQAVVSGLLASSAVHASGKTSPQVTSVGGRVGVVLDLVGRCVDCDSVLCERLLPSGTVWIERMVYNVVGAAISVEGADHSVQRLACSLSSDEAFRSATIEMLARLGHFRRWAGKPSVDDVVGWVVGLSNYQQGITRVAGYMARRDTKDSREHWLGQLRGLKQRYWDAVSRSADCFSCDDHVPCPCSVYWTTLLGERWGEGSAIIDGKTSALWEGLVQVWVSIGGYCSVSQALTQTQGDTQPDIYSSDGCGGDMTRGVCWLLTACSCLVRNVADGLQSTPMEMYSDGISELLTSLRLWVALELSDAVSGFVAVVLREEKLEEAERPLGASVLGLIWGHMKVTVDLINMICSAWRYVPNQQQHRKPSMPPCAGLLSLVCTVFKRCSRIPHSTWKSIGVIEHHQECHRALRSMQHSAATDDACLKLDNTEGILELGEFVCCETVELLLHLDGSLYGREDLKLFDVSDLYAARLLEEMKGVIGCVGQCLDKSWGSGSDTIIRRRAAMASRLMCVNHSLLQHAVFRCLSIHQWILSPISASAWRYSSVTVPALPLSSDSDDAGLGVLLRCVLQSFEEALVTLPEDQQTIFDGPNSSESTTDRDRETERLMKMSSLRGCGSRENGGDVANGLRVLGRGVEMLVGESMGKVLVHTYDITASMLAVGQARVQQLKIAEHGDDEQGAFETEERTSDGYILTQRLCVDVSSCLRGWALVLPSLLPTIGEQMLGATAGGENTGSRGVTGEDNRTFVAYVKTLMQTVPSAAAVGGELVERAYASVRRIDRNGQLDRPNSVGRLDDWHGAHDDVVVDSVSGSVWERCMRGEGEEEHRRMKISMSSRKLPVSADPEEVLNEFEQVETAKEELLEHVMEMSLVQVAVELVFTILLEFREQSGNQVFTTETDQGREASADMWDVLDPNQQCGRGGRRQKGCEEDWVSKLKQSTASFFSAVYPKENVANREPSAERVDALCKHMHAGTDSAAAGEETIRLLDEYDIRQGQWDVESPCFVWLLAAHVFYLLVRVFPSTVRRLWHDCCPNAAARKELELLTNDLVTWRLIQADVAAVQGSLANSNLSFTYERRRRELKTCFSDDRNEVKAELIVKFRAAHPLKFLDVVAPNIPGVPRKRQSNWVRGTMRAIRQGGSLYSGVYLWCENLRLYFEGLEDCPICLSVVHPTHKSLPKRQCATCKLKFHLECLHRWFTSSGKQSCPHCQTPLSSQWQGPDPRNLLLYY
eukprot:GHVQ01012992.1.p1 GENE.GHVQ01012992.1~~GHVQ01012992.1.p1  ORF type:complete len:1587 (+),score=238.53 GHVQ01012992.1:369-5129(+)